LNVVLDDAVEEKDGGEKVKLGMVVSRPILPDFVGIMLTPYSQVIRGNSVVMLEALERIGGDDRGR
jgi:small nuclear ribonucleoprotein G